MNRPLFLLAVPLLTLCAGAQADFYSHRYAGVAYFDQAPQQFCDNVSPYVQSFGGEEISVAMGSCEEKVRSWKIYGGWRWTPHLALEASFQKLGKNAFSFQAENLAPQVGEFTRYNEGNKISTSLGNLSLIGHWPLWEGLSLYGKVGGGAWSSSLTQRANISWLIEVGVPAEQQEAFGGETAIVEVSQSGDFRDTRTGFQWSYGAGVNYRHHNSWSIRAEWENFADIGSENFFGGDDLQALSLGWSMHF